MTPDTFPIIKTDRLLLRQFIDSDLPSVFQGLSHPEVIQYYGVSYDSLEATRDQMKFFNDLEEHGTGLWWAICDVINGHFYGAAGLNNLIKEHNKAEIGCWLLKEFWGRGIMQEVLPVICHYGFEHLGLHRIEGLVESDNIKCKQAMAKLDFQYEGIMRDCEIKNGKYISLDIYGLLNQ